MQSSKNDSPPTPSQKNSSRKYKSFGTRSHVTPFKFLNIDFQQNDNLKSSDVSMETFGRFSSSIESEASDQENLQSPLLQSIKNIFPDSIEYENELEAHRKENLILKSKINQLQEENFDKHDKNKIFTGSEQEVKIELKKQKKLLEKAHKASLEKQKQEIMEECQKEFELYTEQLINKIRKEQQKIFAEKKKELEESYNYEIKNLEKDHEGKLRIKISEISREYERQLNRVQEEADWLRKQNESLKSQLEEANTKTEIAKSSSKRETLFSNSTLDQNKQYHEICKSYNQLQHDYLELKKKKSGGLCTKCRAFTERNDELSGKISRIIAYIDSKNVS